MPAFPNRSSPKGVQRSDLRRENCGPKRKLYSRVVASNVGKVVGHKGGQVGKGVGTATGIFVVPNNSQPSTINPSQWVALKARDASQPSRPAQWPALKKLVSA